MKTKLNTVVAVSVLTLGLAACEMHNPYNPAPGSYDRTVSSTDANGTTYEQENSTDVVVKKNGTKKVVTKSKTTKDPKGLMNKTTTGETKQEIETK